ncbi:unnamed protein product [Didymodactylos carnosus]|uniref:Uncharacterized protein n=1 Tax=Didymodactylos carnosus TaxID=1234261 RepID=A0A8S2FXQ3_9BILA|nr:unnamed protein product [Didymodactylos carnosus]CAF4367862.1 unnamed protein product [Didymodactylos carnosus]
MTVVIWEAYIVRNGDIYYLYVNATLQLPFLCASESSCQNSIQTALEETPLTSLTLSTENGQVIDILVERPTVQGLKPFLLHGKCNRIDVIVGLVLATLSLDVCINVLSPV